jgi:hypothetical protein
MYKVGTTKKGCPVGAAQWIWDSGETQAPLSLILADRTGMCKNMSIMHIIMLENTRARIGEE